MENKISVRENVVLIDKVVFGNIRIKNIEDMNKLARQGLLEVNEKNRVRYITESGQEFTRIHIKSDGVIDRLVAGTKILGNQRTDFCVVDASIGNEETGNLCCYDVEQYADYLLRMQSHLKDQYGIEADVSRVTLKKIEINRTFRLNGDFDSYGRVLVLLMANLPCTFKNQMEYMDKDGNVRKTESYYAKTGKKRYMEFTIYNKSKSVEKSIILTEEYMRVEIRLVGSEKIKKSLGTNRFYEITDELINQYFDAQIQKMIVKPCEKWAKERDKFILSVMREQLEKNRRHWQVETLCCLLDEEVRRRRPVLLDISELISIVDKAMKIEDRRQRYKAKSGFRKRAERYATAYCQNDHLKLQEIVAKLTTKVSPQKG